MAVLTGYFDVSTFSSIQLAENACEAGGKGGVLYFPPGVYYVTTTVTIGLSKVQWLGAGAGASIIVGNVSGANQPTVVETHAGSGISNIMIQGIGFTGNNYPPGSSSSAPPVILFNGGEFNKVIECYFTLNQGRTIDFEGVTDGEVCRCRFYNVGYNGNTAQTTEAVYVDSTSVGVRIHHNYLDTCNFGGVALNGTASDASHNRLTNTSGVGVYVAGKDTRIGLNSITKTKQVSGAGRCSGIQASAASEFCIIGNNVSFGEGDGISVINGWAYGTLIGNNCWDNEQNGGPAIGDAGISLISDQSAPGVPPDQGLVLVGNNSFDEAATHTQSYGLHINTNNASLAYNTVIVGNSFSGNATQDIFEHAAVMQDESNTILGNTFWLDRLHTTAPVSTSLQTFTQLRSVLIAAGSMRQRCGIRITAGGSTSGTNDKKHFQLGFGLAGNIFTYDTTDSSSGTWQLIAFIVNDSNSPTTQAATALLFYNNALVHTYENTLNRDTTSGVSVLLYARVSNTSDSITNDYFTVERF